MAQLSKREKEDIFEMFAAEGREIYYDSNMDIVYSDVNETLTDKHLGLCMLKHLDEDIHRMSLSILNENRNRSDAIRSIAKLLAGKSSLELRAASTKAASEVNVPSHLQSILTGLKPTQLVLWSDTPRETIEAFKDMKLYPLYNKEGTPAPIYICATDMEYTNGMLTGNIRFMPDQSYRQNMHNFEALRYARLMRGK